MVGLAYDEGVAVEDLAARYGLDVDEIESWTDELASNILTVSIARRVGIDFQSLAGRSGLGRETIADWFEVLAEQQAD